MRKRPLCVVGLIVIVILWILPSGIWLEHPLPEGGELPEFLYGQICGMETEEKGQTVYLEKTNLSDTGIILVSFPAKQECFIGNTLFIKQPFTLKEPEAPGNPGQFDAQMYNRTRDIVLFCNAQEAEVVDPQKKLLSPFLYELRGRLEEISDKLFGPRESGVLKAMLLGDKSTLQPEVKTLYSKAGISHVLAISGLHISLVGMSLYRLLRKLRLSYWAAGIPSMCLVIGYGSMTGMSISTARAVLMFLLAVTADILGKSYDMLTALAVAALVLLIQEPLYARSASFLLSFGAILGIGFLYPALYELFPTSKKILQAFLFSLSVQFFTFPLVQYFYFEFSLYSLFLNLCVIPLMSVLMPAGILTLLLGLCSVYAAVFPALICKGILRLYEGVSELSLGLPGSVVICGKPEIWQMAVYYLGLAGFLYWRYRVHEKEKWEREEKKQKEHRRKERLICIGVFLILNSCLLLRFSSGLTFTMLDVGQGDGLFLRTAEGTACLIDGGSSSVEKVGTYRIQPFLKAEGVKKLDYVFITHVDADHTSGIRELLEQAGEPGSIRMDTLVLTEQALETAEGQKLQKLAQEKEIRVMIFGAGMSLQEKHTRIHCLFPTKEGVYEEENGSSLVLQVIYQDFSLLLTGDLEEAGETELLKENRLEICDVLKVGHHGSRNSTTEAFLQEVQPEVALISCGKENLYGHPHEETLERLEGAGSTVLTTPECGAVTLRSDGTAFWIESYRKDWGK